MAFRAAGLRMEDLFSVKIDCAHRDDDLEGCSNEDLEDAFAKFGKVMDVYIPRDFRNNRARGFAFVRYQHEDEAKDAAAKGEIEVAKIPLTITLATRPKGPPRGRSRGRRDSRGRGGGYGGRSRGRRDSRDRGRGYGRRDSRRR